MYSHKSKLGRKWFLTYHLTRYHLSIQIFSGGLPLSTVMRLLRLKKDEFHFISARSIFELEPIPWNPKSSNFSQTFGIRKSDLNKTIFEYFSEIAKRIFKFQIWIPSRKEWNRVLFLEHSWAPPRDHYNLSFLYFPNQ